MWFSVLLELPEAEKFIRFLVNAVFSFDLLIHLPIKTN